MEADRIGVVYPRIDDLACVNCHTCEKVCPIITLNLLVEIRKYYALNNNEDECSTSASGGIAIVVYRKTLANEMIAIGASQDAVWSVIHKVMKMPLEFLGYVAHTDMVIIVFLLHCFFHFARNQEFLYLYISVESKRFAYHRTSSYLLIG